MPSADPPGEVRLPDTAALLAAAVKAIGGTERPGQVRMAEAVARAIATGEHLAAQAGTGTGKSLAYLVPAIRHAVAADTTVVVSTATIALQRQLVDRDLPRLAEALRPLLGQEPRFAILKGRGNYLCLHRVHTGAPDEPEDAALFDPQQLSALGRQVKRLHEWAEQTVTGDRDELVPGVSEQAWRQVSVSARECLGAQRCPHGESCFAEQARAEAGQAHIVVTNHALLAIDALEGRQVLPEHDVVIVDEAHELVDRVTAAGSGALSGPAAETAARRCGRLIEEGVADRLKEAAEKLAALLEDLPAGRLDVLPEPLGRALAALRDAAHACLTALGSDRADDPAALAARRAVRSTVEELHDTAVRMLESFEPQLAARSDVVWLDKPLTGPAAPDGPRRPPTLHIAPISVGGLLRTALFGTRTTILTSATLTLGGSFEPLARQWGLPPLSSAQAPAANRAGGRGPADLAPPAGHRSGDVRAANPSLTDHDPAGGSPHPTAQGSENGHPAAGHAAASPGPGVCDSVDGRPSARGGGKPNSNGHSPPHAARGPSHGSNDGQAADPRSGGHGPAGDPSRSAGADGSSAESGPGDDRSRAGREPADVAARQARPQGPGDPSGEGGELRWSALDAGSPFDHAKAGILYVARHLPQPGRDGLPEAYLTEIAELIEAAGGRTLGLFSSMRAARQAAEELRGRLGHPLLCQGEDATSLLVKRFAEEERTCLFGTLSLWQGVDVPGPSLQLVIMDRIPFPRPDDPIASARQRAVAARGGNGFMAVAATQAALLLAQGAGRLLRSATDRGVVAILDPRLATARYGGFLRSSLPPFWTTTDPAVVRGALRRLDAAVSAA